MSPSPRSAAKATATNRKAEPPAALRSGQRLGSNARRDIRWALQQTPGDAVRDVTLHGVKICFNTNTTNKSQEKGGAPNRRDDSRRDAQPTGDAEKPTNSRQRRSRARAKKHHAQLKQDKVDEMEQDKPASSRPPGLQPLE